MKQITKRVLLAGLLSALLCLQTFAAAPFAGYEYSTDNYNGLIVSEKDMANAKPAPSAFVYEKALNSTALGLETPMNTPEDMVCDEKGNVYILDTLNGRIVVVDPQRGQVLCLLTGWQSPDGTAATFEGGRGMCYREGTLYVCLTAAQKIVAAPVPAFSETREPDAAIPELTPVASRVVESPDLSAIRDNFEFKPAKVAVDRSERLYVVVEGVFDGLMTIDSDNSFAGFVGANRIQISALDLLWRALSTDAQIAAQQDTVPIEFNNLAIDEDGFLYTTAKGNESENLIRRLNLIGNDVLERGTAYMKGELSPLVKKGNPGAPSNLVDIAVAGNGIYSCLDNIRGRIFTYNGEGDLLFVFGGISAQKGAFQVPAALEWCGGRLLVLDKGNNELVVFRPTAYGEAVLKATATQFNGGYGESWEEWREVIAMNPQNQTAHRNVGKLLYDQGDYAGAMTHFQLGNSPNLYSKAFAKYRNIQAEKIVPWAAAGLAAVLLVVLAIQLVRFAKRSRQRWEFFREEARRYRERNRKN